MSISTYAELQTAVAAYLHRSGLTTEIPGYFIVLAEAKLNRRLRTMSQETTATGAVAATVALPSDFLELISLTVTEDGSTYPISYKPTGKIVGDSGSTNFYSFVGTDIKFEPVASGVTYTLTYYKKIPALSAGVNWLITQAPDIYLSASLLEAAIFIKNDAAAGGYSAGLESSIALLTKQEISSRYGNNLASRAG